MASVSYSLPLGAEATSDGAAYMEDAITLGTSAPGVAGTVEMRVELATTNPTRKDVVRALYAFIRRIEGSRFGPSDFGSV